MEVSTSQLFSRVHVNTFLLVLDVKGKRMFVVSIGHWDVLVGHVLGSGDSQRFNLFVSARRLHFWGDNLFNF
jgi:hypothetical protein